MATALRPFELDGGENPYTLHQELQQTMNDLVGIIRKEAEMAEALTRIDELKERAQHLSVEGGRAFNPGWHLALDLRNMLLVSECVARAALLRQESRGGHTRDDYPDDGPDVAAEAARLLGHRRRAGQGRGGADVDDARRPHPLFQKDELKKYLTPEEIEAIPQ